MGIMDFFNGSKASEPAATPAAAPVTPGQLPPTAGATAPGNSTLPAGTTTTTPGSEPSPLDSFADLWQAPAAGPGDAPLFGNVDPKKLMEAAAKTDFSQVLTPEMQSAIKAGGQGAMEVMVSAMNKMTQASYANSAMATTKIVEQALERQQKAFEAKLPGIIKQHTLSDTLRSENPVLSNPAIQPFIAAMESQLATKHPNATASELNSMAKQYIEGLGSVFSPKAAPTKEETNAAQDTDWAKFFS